MLSRRTSRRTCKEYERVWNGYCVDRNLADDWLVRLNALQAFNLLSICEGHSKHRSEPAGAPPHIKLRLKESFIPNVANRWDEHKMAVLDKITQLFQSGDTYVNLELKFKLRSTTGRLNYEESLIVRIYSNRARVSEEMDAETREWFNKSVGRIEEIDGLIVLLWQTGS